MKLLPTSLAKTCTQDVFDKIMRTTKSKAVSYANIMNINVVSIVAYALGTAMLSHYNLKSMTVILGNNDTYDDFAAALGKLFLEARTGQYISTNSWREPDNTTVSEASPIKSVGYIRINAIINTISVEVNSDRDSASRRYIDFYHRPTGQRKRSIDCPEYRLLWELEDSDLTIDMDAPRNF